MNLSDVRSIAIMEGQDNENEKAWGVKAFFTDTSIEPVVLYISRDKEAIETVFDNLEKVLQAGRVIKLKLEDECKNEDTTN